METTKVAPPGRDEIRQMVEENWRQFLTFAAEGSKELGAEVISRFDERNKKLADAMSADDAKSFLAMVEDERSKVFDEYSANPTALKRRLGVTSNSNRSRSRQSIGETAVKTAVRASIWAAIWSLFR